MPEPIIIAVAAAADAAAILALQKLAYQSEAQLYNDFSISPLLQNLEELRREFFHKAVLKATLGQRIIGSVRAFKKATSASWSASLSIPTIRGGAWGPL